jgi:capsular exopolysaccharide synthesis family protein
MVEETVDLHALFVRFLRRLPVFLVVFAAIMAGAVFYTYTRTPMYTAAASIVIEAPKTDVLRDNPTNTPTDSATVDTQVQVLGSRALAKRVVQRLGLQRDPEFNPALRPKSNKFNLKSLIRLATPSTSTTAPRLTPAQQALENTTDVVLSRTRARRNGLTYVIDVSFTSVDGEKAANIANAIAQEFIFAQMDTKYQAARGASDWVNGRLSALAREVESNEAAVQQYKISHNLMSAQGATMAEQELSTLNQQIASARAELAEKQARLAAAQAQISRGGGGGDVAAALGSSVVSQLRQQRSEVSRKQAELETRYGPLHPDVKKVQRELADVDAQINEEIGRIISNLQAEVQVAQQRLGSLENSRARAQGSLGANNAAIVGLNELQRRADASRAVYEAFLNRSKETSAQEGLQRPDARVSSPAQAPSWPTSPNKPLNLALGFVLAVAGGVAAILLLENLDSGLRTSVDVEQKLRMPNIGSVPLLTRTGRTPKASYVLTKPFSGFAEAFRNLKTSLTLARDDRQIRIVAIASALPGEGKTLTTTSFGRLLAQSGSKVLIVDGDVRRHMLTESFGRRPEVGLVEVLEGSARLEDALLTDEESGAHLLLLSDSPVPTEDLLSSDALTSLFARLREEYDFVVIDTAPVLAVAETRVIAVRADATIFLVKWSKTPRQAADAALDLLVNAGAFVAGVCLTQVDMSKQARFGYGDKLYYYHGYRKYYSE